MIRRFLVSAAAVLAISLPICGQAPGRTILVNVEQTVTVVPDVAIFELRLGTRTLRAPDEVAQSAARLGLQGDLVAVQPQCSAFRNPGVSEPGGPAYVLQLRRPYSDLAPVQQALENGRAPLTAALDLAFYRYSLVGAEPSDSRREQAEEQVRAGLEEAVRRRAEALALAAGLRLGAVVRRSNFPLTPVYGYFHFSNGVGSSRDDCFDFLGVPNFGSFLLGLPTPDSRFRATFVLSAEYAVE